MIIPSSSSGPRVALISGAGSGLGRSLSELMHGRGWLVAGVDAVEASVADLALTGDVTDPHWVREAVRKAADEFGQLNGVATCAGVFPDPAVPTHRVVDATWDRVIAVNLTGTFHVARETLPHLMRSRGAIVFVASVASESPQPGASSYAASKAGVLGLARAVALEYGRAGVRANAVSPGWMDTPMAGPVLSRPHLRSRIESRIPRGSVADPRDVAHVIEFLLSDRAGQVTGENVRIEGGQRLTSFVADRLPDENWLNDRPPQTSHPDVSGPRGSS